MIATRLKHGIILRSQSTTWLASIRGQRPWNCVKVFLTVNENLRILQYLFISHRYQYLIYILLIFDKHWKFLYKKNYHLYIYFVFIWKQHAVNAFSAVHYHVIRHTEMLLEGFSREMPPILTCHLSWMISQQLGRVHGYVTETSFNVNTKKKHHFLNNCKIIWPQNKRVNLSWIELYLFSSRIWLMSADVTEYACMCNLQRKH